MKDRFKFRVSMTFKDNYNEEEFKLILYKISIK